MTHDQAPPLRAILQLAAMQIEVALQAAESQVAALADAVASIAGLAGELPRATNGLAGSLQRHAQEAIVAMQYHDQLMQRLAHVRDALTDLQRAIALPAGPDHWGRVLEAVRGRFSMEDERLLFDQVLGRPAGEDAPARASVPDSARGGVELF